LGEIDKAAICFEENVTRKDREDNECSEIQEALIFLARYYKAHGKLDEALKKCRRL
jgi:tetratricopeptide (TPR) repeat protein